MARAKREYDVLLAVTMSKTVRVRARSMKEASGVIFDRIPDEDQLGSPDFSTHVGSERVIDVVRAGDPWHFERAALGGGERKTHSINLLRDLGYDESSPDVIAARARAAMEGGE